MYWSNLKQIENCCENLETILLDLVQINTKNQKTWYCDFNYYVQEQIEELFQVTISVFRPSLYNWNIIIYCGYWTKQFILILFYILQYIFII